LEDSERTQIPLWIYGFEAVCFLLIIATRFFLNYFQSYHALASFITLFVALFGSFGEDFLGKMVNKLSSPNPSAKAIVCAS